MKRKLTKRRILALLALLILLLAPLFFLAVNYAGSKPSASVTYLGLIDGKGHWKLRFAITNVGNCSLFPSTSGEIEVFGQRNTFPVAANTPMNRLAPGEGRVVEVLLSEAQIKLLSGKWRYTSLLASDGLRSRIYRWQWGPNGPGARVNWLIPRKLKGMPLPEKATTEWIETAK